MSPFRNGEFTYATDGRVIVRVSASDYPSETRTSAPKNLDILGEWNGRDSWQRIPKISPITRPEIIPCPACKGTGADPQHPAETCYECDGDAEEETRNEPISLGFAAAADRYLLKIAALPNVEIAATGSDKAPIPFRFLGGVGLLMPMNAPY